jgi:hypothetical protein
MNTPSDPQNTIFHLTSNGWFISDSPPPDRVETWNCCVRDLPAWSRQLIDWTCMWANPNVPRAERDILRVRFAVQMHARARGGAHVSVDEAL